MRGSAGVRCLHGDHLGSVSLSTTSSGAQQMTSRYGLFGSVRTSSGGAVSDYRFTAQRQESLGNNWIYDYNGRFYNASIGRFLSADTLVPGAGNPQALNRYSYVYNDPLKYTDPSGHCAVGDYADETIGIRQDSNGADVILTSDLCLTPKSRPLKDEDKL